MLIQTSRTAALAVAPSPVAPHAGFSKQGEVSYPQNEIRHAGYVAKNFIQPEILSQDLFAIRDTAIQVWRALSAGRNVGKLAKEFTNLDGFSIGHMMHHIEKKGLFLTDARPEEIMDVLFLGSDPESKAYPSTRHKFIAALKKHGYIDRDLTDKEFKPAGTTPSLRDICGLIHEITRISQDEITSASRSRNVVQARFRAIWVLRQVCGYSLSMIGRHMGDRDHTTILNSVNKVMLQISTDIGMRDAMETLCENSDKMGIMRNHDLMVTHMSN